jgi:hypothetical protein
MSSAFAALFVAAALLIGYPSGSTTVREGIDVVWEYIALPSILMLAIGGYLVARRGKI